MEVTTNRDGKVGSLIDTAYNLFQNGFFRKAAEVLEEALSLDFENNEVLFALKCAQFWSDKTDKYDFISDKGKAGSYLLDQWKNFVLFLDRSADSYENCLYTLRQYVFAKALSCFSELSGRHGKHEAGTFFRIGKCYKGLGDYERALEYLEVSNHQKADDPEILAELADCYAFIGEVKAAKIFFREAFFINPQKIEICMLESLLILRLIVKLKKMGYTSPELEEWIPVYGVVFGVLNVKRELKPLEYGRLKQSIFAMEAEMKEIGEDAGFFHKPRLLNRYFWLIDHLVTTKENHEKIDEVLEKIKKIDPQVYEQYIQ